MTGFTPDEGPRVLSSVDMPNVPSAPTSDPAAELVKIRTKLDRRLGEVDVLHAERVPHMRALKAAGMSFEKIGTLAGISPQRVFKILQEPEPGQ